MDLMSQCFNFNNDRIQQMQCVQKEGLELFKKKKY